MKAIKPITVLLLTGLLIMQNVRVCAAEPAPSGLLCNLLTHPEDSVITERQPDFGWIVNSSQSADRQTAYRIIVASSPALLEKDTGDLWDSGKMASSQSINVLYAGQPLVPNSSYWWSVRTWNKDDRASAFSRPQKFNTGEFNRQAKKWPGESRWVQIPDGQGGKTWTFEDRPPVRFHPQVPASIATKADGTWFLDFGKAAFAVLEMKVSWTPSSPAAKDGEIQVAVGEKRRGNSVDAKPGGGIIYSKTPLKIMAGEHSYTMQIPRFVPKYPHSQAMPGQMPEVIPFRYCEIMPGAEKITVKDARQLALWTDFDETASAFASSNKLLDEVYELCKYSVKVNTFNGDYAASQRERMMYEADSHIHQLSHYAVDRAFATARYSQENMIFHASWPTEWIPHSIFMAWADYLNTGNSRSLAKYYDELKPKTLLALAADDGLISTRTGRQSKEFLKSIHFNGRALRDIVDWPTKEADGYEFKDFNTVVNAFHYQSLVRMSQIAQVLNQPDDAQFYRERADLVLAAINAKMFDRQRGIYVDGIGSTHSSLHANLFALAFGIVPESNRRTVVDFIKSRGMACSVYPTAYLLEALFDSGAEQAAIDLMTSDTDRSWLNMIRVGSTVTTEAWDIKYKGNSGWTHAWSSAPAQILPRKLLGIEPLEPGFGKIRICPRPGNLTYARARLPTIRGHVDAEFTRNGTNSFELNVMLPANMSAELVLPDMGNQSDELTVNGRPAKGILGAGRIRLSDLGSGNWHVIRRSRDHEGN